MMKDDQQLKCHVCRFCKQGFSNEKKLEDHMRRHLALIASCGAQEDNHEPINGEKGFYVFNNDDDDDTGVSKQSIQENDQEIINGGKGLDFDHEIVKKSQQQHDSGANVCGFRQNSKRSDDIGDRKQSIQETIKGGKGLDFDHVMVNKSQQEQDSGANVYVLRQIPKRSSRVSSSSKDCDPSRTESMKNNSVCKKCGRVFESMKALYGHMRCHSIKRSRPLNEWCSLSSSEGPEDDWVANQARKKRSFTRYKSVNHSHVCTGLSSFEGDEVEKGAICLMMLSRGLKDLDGGKTVNSHQDEFHSSEFEVSVESEKRFDC